MLEWNSEAYKHNGDHDLLASLGLRTWSFDRDWTDLGTVVVEEERTEAHGNPLLTQTRPAATIKVEVSAMPAQFWRFTIERPNEEIVELGDGQWRVEYTVGRHLVETGSGGFGIYWPSVKLIAGNMLIVTNEPEDK